MSDFDEKYIKKCLKMAKKAEGLTSPNPLVGAFVLDKDLKIAGIGYHHKYGEAHAEIVALNQAGERALGGTLYINLEPCCHYGKTPPCTDRVIASGIKELVAGMTDPNPLVAGKGLEIVKQAGITVKSGVLEKDCLKLNEIFVKNMTKKASFIAIKSAITLDGKIASRTGSSKWITSEKSRSEVQKLRNKYDALLTGSGTIIKDNPSLTCRMKNGRNPVRVNLDSKLSTSPTSKVYSDDGAKVIIACSEKANKDRFKLYPQNVEFLLCPVEKNSRLNLTYVTAELYKKGIMSILVEAGGELNGSFLKESLVDKFYIFTAPKILGDREAWNFAEGFDTDDINKSLNFRFDEIKALGIDLFIEAYSVK